MSWSESPGRKTANGFTIGEMLLVLLTAGILAMLTTSIRQVPLEIFMAELQNRILKEQVIAYATGSSRKLEITGDALQTENGVLHFPENVACTPFQWHYTQNGTISTAGTVTCMQGDDSHQLVFRIGAGRVDLR